MSRRRDVRRFGRGPYLLGLRRRPAHWGAGFPFDVPAVAAVEAMRLDAPVTLLAGQSFLALAANRFGGHGLFVLDEPEAALSVSGALALLAIVVRAAEAGAQFVVATHSPVLLACPGARIYELDDAGLAPCAYNALDTVRLTRGFLDAPERFIRAALAEPEGD